MFTKKFLMKLKNLNLGIESKILSLFLNLKYNNSMKKNILLTTVIILCTVPFCFSQVQNSIKEKVKNISHSNIPKKIDDEFNSCLEKEDITYHQMLQCTIEGKNKYNIEIEKTVKKLKKVLSDEQYSKLIKSQQKWQEFYEQDNSFLDSTFGDNYPPYMPITISENYKLLNAKYRLEQLYEILYSTELYKQNAN